MTYAEKFKDPRWQKKRLEVLERDKWACKNCGDSESTLHVHHKYYTKGKDPWEYPIDAFLTLCAECHECEHSSRTDYEDGLLKTLRKKGFAAGDIFSLVEGFCGLEMQASPQIIGNALWILLQDAPRMRIVINEFIDWTNTARVKRNSTDLMERLP